MVLTAVVTLCAAVALARAEQAECTDAFEDQAGEAMLAWHSLMQVAHANPTMAGAPVDQRRSTGGWAAHGGTSDARAEPGAIAAPGVCGGAADVIPCLISTAAVRVAGKEFAAFGSPSAPGPANATALPTDGLGERSDLFGTFGNAKQGDTGWAFFASAPTTDWVILGVVCMVLFLIDLLLIQRLPSSFRVHLLTVGFWFLAAVGYVFITWYRFDRDMALDWCTGYLLEWILSMDNLFVFHLIFETYQTPPAQTHKAVFLGIVGAVVIRLVFFMTVSALLHCFFWVRYPFGLLLIWSGIQAAMGDDEDADIKDTYAVRACKWIMGSRLREDYDEEGRMIVFDSKGGLQFTLLFMIVVILELSDVVFALDSVSAKIAQVPQQYVAFSSTAIAMYGLRAMFFIVQDLVEMFDLLQYGLCLILVWIGLQLMLSQWIHLSAGMVCILIASIFIVFTCGSVLRRQMGSRRSSPREQDNAEAPACSESGQVAHPAA